jgi:hypothetical protein
MTNATPIHADGMTLSQVLAKLGWTHQKHTNSNRQGREIYHADGTYLGVFDARDCWAMLYRTGLIVGTDVNGLIGVIEEISGVRSVAP